MRARCTVGGSLLFGIALAAAGRADEPPASVELKVVRGVTYVERESGPLKADVYLPLPLRARPGVLMVHGGAWMSGSRSQMAGHAALVARAGYSVVSIDYRLAPRHKFPAQLEDCQAALGWMRQEAAEHYLNSARIAGYGYSAGGHLVCLVGMVGAAQADGGAAAAGDAGPGLQAVVAGGAPCDFRQVPPHVQALAYWLGGTRQQLPQRYRLASPAAFVSAAAPPTFFFHGQEDRLVPQASPRGMMQQLLAAGVPATMFLVPEQGHLGAFLDRRAIQEAVSFLDRVLKSGETAEPLTDVDDGSEQAADAGRAPELPASPQ